VPRILTEILPTFISVLGAPSSGKSYFLASAVWQARKQLHSFHVTFTDADPVANQVISAYETKLFLSDKPTQLVAIPKTQQQGDLYQLVDYGDRQEFYARPFVFALRPTEEHVLLRNSSAARTVSRALCLYDNAGEHFQPMAESELSPATDHLALSEALIFVFDPLQHPKFRNLCRVHSEDPQLGDEFNCHRQDEILLEAAKRIRQKANMPAHERFSRPLIVAVTKYDTWGPLIRDLDLQSIAPYCQLPDGSAGLDLGTLGSVSRQVEAVVRHTAPEVVAACESFCKDVIYIPISPQGCAPIRVEGQQLGVRPNDLSPVWAEVPLLYSLCRAKCSLVPAASNDSVPRAPFSQMPDDRGDSIAPHIYTGTD
jgi:hypothetical protein